MDNITRKVKNTLSETKQKQTPRNSRKVINQPVSARSLYRSGETWARSVEPASLMLTTASDVYGPNAYNFGDLTCADIRKMVLRYKAGVLYASYYDLPEIDMYGGDWACTEPVAAAPTDDEIMIACAMGDPIPEAMSDEDLEPYKERGEELLNYVLKFVYKTHGSLRSFYEHYKHKDGTYKRIAYSAHRQLVCDVAEPKLVYRCMCCKNLNCVDVRPTDEQGYRYFESLKPKTDEKSVHILKNRGLDINFMAHKFLKGKFSLRKYEPEYFYPDQENALSSLYACDECGRSLLHVYVDEYYENDENAPPVMLHANMRGNFKLEELKIMGYTDHYERMNPSARQALIVNDSRIVRKMQASLRMGVITLPANLGREKLKELLSENPGLIMKPSSKCLPGNPNMHADISVAVGWCVNNLSLKEAVITDCSAKPSKHLHYNNAKEWLTKLPYTESINCPANIVGESGISLPILADFVRANNIVYCLSIMSNNNTFANQDGVICTNKGMLLAFSDGVSMPMMLNAAYYEAIDHGQFSVDSVSYMLRRVRQCGNIAISVCTPYSSSAPIVKVSDDTDQTFSIVVPTIMGPMGRIPILNLVSKQVTIRRKLMRMLTIRNMTGSMNADSLLEYALAYCNTVYTVRGQRITNKDITYEEIRVHVVMCQAMVASLTGRSRIQHEFNQYFMWLGPLRNKLFSELKLPSVVIEFAVNIISQLGNGIVDSVCVNLGNSWNKTGWSQYKELWNNLIDIGYSPVLSTHVDATIYKPMKCCPHHVGKCSHKQYSGNSRCKCCKVSIKLNDAYCRCCAPADVDMMPDKFSWNTQKSRTEKILSTDNNATDPNYGAESQEQEEAKVELSIDDFLPTTKTTAKFKQAYVTTALSLQTPAEDKVLPSEFKEAVKDYPAYCNEFSFDGEEIRLPYTPAGIYSVKTFVEILSNEDVSQNDEECGIDCLEHIGNNLHPVPRRTIIAVVGKNKWLTVQDLAKGASSMSLNLIVLHNTEATIIATDSSKPFFCIAHSSALEPGTEERHYYLAKFKVTSTPAYPLTVDTSTNYYDLIKLMNNVKVTLESLHGDDKLVNYARIMAVITNRAKREFSFGYLNVIDGVQMMSYPKGNRVNNWVVGRYCVPVRSEFAEQAQELHAVVNARLPIESVNRMSGLPLDLEQDVKNIMHMNLTTMQQVLSSDVLASTSDLAMKFEPVQLTPTTDGYTANVTLDCKSFDVIIIKYASSAGLIKTTGIVLSNFDSVISFIPKHSPLPLTVQMSKLKISTGSALRKILSLIKLSPDRRGLVQFLKNSECVYGVAGSGKTTRIRTEAKPQDLVVCMTRNLRQELTNDARIKCPVMSSEKMMLETKHQSGTLWLDEATMQDYTILLAAHNLKFKRVVLLGDKQQVGYVDMYSDAGVRETDDAMTTAVSVGAPAQELTFSHRIGNPCAMEIAKVSSGFVGNPHITTSFAWHNVADLKGLHTWFDQLKSKTNLVLCMYQDTRRTLLEILPIKRGENVDEGFNPETCIKTAHAHQGSECNHVMLILMQTSKGSWGLNGDANYLTSAMTRCKLSLTVVVVGVPSITDIAAACVTVQGGAKRQGKSKYKLKSTKHEVRLDGVLQSDAILEIGSHTNPFDELLNILQPNVLKIEYHIGTTPCTAARSGPAIITTGETPYGTVIINWTSNTEFNIVKNGTYLPNSAMERMIKKNNLSVPKTFKIIPTASETNTPVNVLNSPTSLAVKLSTLATTRIKLLAWMMEMCGTEQLGLSTENDVLTIKRTKGCSLMAGITLTWASDKLLITHAYNFGIRNMYISTDGLSNWLLDWLEGESDLDGLPVIDVGWKELIFFWSERLSHAPWLSSWRCQSTEYCTKIEEEHARKMEVKHNLEPMTLQFHTLYSPHTTVMLADLASNGNTKLHIISEDAELNSRTLQTSSMFDCIELINIAIMDVRATSRLTCSPLMGSMSNDLRKLSIPASEHIKHGTEVGMMITGLVTNIKLAIAEKPDDMVWVGNYSEELDRVMNQTLPLINIRSTQGYDYSSELMMISEAMLTCLVGKDNDCLYMYCGPLPSLCAMNNQHYARFDFLANDNCLRSELEMDKPRYNYCVNQYLENVKKTKIVTSYNELVVQDYKDAVVNLGWTINCLPAEKLLELTMHNRAVYGIIPSKDSSHVKWMDNVLTIKGMDVAVVVNEFIYDRLQTGQPIQIGENTLGFSNLMTTAEFTIVSLKCNSPLMYYRWVSSYEVQGDLITVKCPNLNLDISSLLQGGSLITTVERRVSRKLFNTMMNRLVTRSKSRKDTIAYMRSMLSTEITREDYLGYKFNDNPTIMYDTVNVAMVIKEDLISQVDLWKRTINQLASNTSTDWMTDQIIELMMYLSESLLQTILKPAKELIISALTNGLSELSMNNLKSDFEDMLIKLDPHNGIIVDWSSDNKPPLPTVNQIRSVFKPPSEDLGLLDVQTQLDEHLEANPPTFKYDFDEQEFFDAVAEEQMDATIVQQKLQTVLDEEPAEANPNTLTTKLQQRIDDINQPTLMQDKGNDLVLVMVGSMGDLLPLEMIINHNVLKQNLKIICHSDLMLTNKNAVRIELSSAQFIYDTVLHTGMQTYSKINLQAAVECTTTLQGQLIEALKMTMPKLVLTHLFAPGVVHWCEENKVPYRTYCPFPHRHVQYITNPILSKLGNAVMLKAIKYKLDSLSNFTASDYFNDKSTLSVFDQNLLPVKERRQYNTISPVTASMLGPMKNDEIAKRWLGDDNEPYMLVYLNMLTDDQYANVITMLQELAKMMGFKVLAITKTNNFEQTSRFLSVSKVNVGLLNSKPRLCLHHATAGMTHQVSIWGIVSITIVVFADQPAWTNALKDLGLLNWTTRANKLDITKLSAAVRGAMSAKSIKFTLPQNDQPDLVATVCDLMGLNSYMSNELDFSAMNAAMINQCLKNPTNVNTVSVKEIEIAYNPDTDGGCVARVMDYYGFKHDSEENFESFDSIIHHAIRNRRNIIMLAGTVTPTGVDWNDRAVSIDMFNSDPVGIAMITSSTACHCVAVNMTFKPLHPHKSEHKSYDVNVDMWSEDLTERCRAYELFECDLINSKLRWNQLSNDWESRYKHVCVEPCDVGGWIGFSTPMVDVGHRWSTAIMWGPEPKLVLVKNVETPTGKWLILNEHYNNEVNFILSVMHVPVLKKKQSEKALKLAGKKRASILAYDKQQQREISKYHGQMTDLATNHRNGHLILRSYDNRSHHSGLNLKEKVDNGDITVQFSIPANLEVNFNMFVKTHNAARNRLTYFNNKLAYNTEFMHLKQAKLESIFALNCVQTTTSLVTDEPLELTGGPYKENTSESGAKMLYLETRPFSEAIASLDEIMKTPLMALTMVEWVDNTAAVFWANMAPNAMNLKNLGAIVSSTSKGKITVLTARLEVYIEKSVSGGSKQIELTFKAESAGRSSNKYWWDLPDPTKVEPIGYIDTTYMAGLSYGYTQDVGNVKSTGEEIVGSYEYIVTDDYDTPVTQYEEMELTDDVTTDVIDMWSDLDLTETLEHQMPSTRSYMESKEQAGRIAVERKQVITKYPAKARPVLTKKLYAERNAIVDRLLNVKNIRTMEEPTLSIATRVMNTFCRSDWSEKVSAMLEQEKITYNIEWTKNWIMKHHRSNKVAAELEQFLSEGTSVAKLNDIRVHLKLESLLKSKPIKQFIEQKSRTIMWQAYFVAAIYSPIFMQAKKRFKTLLKPNIIYADGMTPKQINEMLNGLPAPKFFMATDGKKQDKQTDGLLLSVEMLLYRWLGVSEEVMSVWPVMHDYWGYKSTHSKGTCHLMRLTGQSTTAFGNAIVNFIFNSDLYEKNIDSVIALLILGDDNTGMFTHHIDTSEVVQNIAVKYNMEAELETTTQVSTFCSFLVHNCCGGIQMCPDMIRLRNRFEVPNGVSEVNGQNAKMRAMSYMMTVGPTAEVTKIISERDLPISPTMWYNFGAAIKACAIHYDITEELVMSNYATLMNYLQTDDYIDYEFAVYKPAKM
jgi:hypothetical protein